MVHKIKQEDLALKYKYAVLSMAFLENKAVIGDKIDMFDRSVILEALYGIKKKDALDDMLKIRKQVLLERKLG